MESMLLQNMQYKRWANQRLFSTLATLSDAALNRSQPIKFGSILATAQHVVDMDELWKAHLLSEPHNVKSRVPTKLFSIQSLADKQGELDIWFEDYVVNNASSLNTSVAFTYLDGTQGTMTPLQILQHLVNHGTYHRGHIADMLYHEGVTPPVTDFSVFVHQSQHG